MAPPLLPLLCGTAALLLLRAAADTVHCSPPKAVANAHIDAGSRTELNSRLRYSCKPGYKRKAGTSSLIQCILWNGSQPRWTHPTLQCIRDPALSRETPGAASTTQRAGTTSASPNSSPSPAPSQSPVPPAPDGSRPPEMVPTLDTSTLGEGTAPLPIPPTEYAAGWADSQGSTNLPWALFHPQRLSCFSNGIFLLSSLLSREAPSQHPPLSYLCSSKFPFLSSFPVSIQSVASSVGLLVLLAIGIAAICCWRRRRRRKCSRQGYVVTEADVPMEGIPSGNEEVVPPVIVPTG
ncbi:interleukin-15 receptor subunit alpha isoform X1 [Agelaius phoeniceus]|uniref:interleukin-15 receptor subunit alpha isoform X1 n=1 Tax=Agelaius phoeniceus TaxID=39638 RepID=UPI0040550ED1